ncbi:MAG: DUF423 domain-containing protein [Alteromonadaceae bacterium]|jgi:uncharacterized membrane protein YgdD (TMEM256/DUF423 family)
MKTVKLIPLLMIFIGISGTFSVLFGAWLAHVGAGLPQVQRVGLDTALQYQFIHTLALFITLVCYLIQPLKLLIAASLSLVLGILLFSGGLYMKILFGLSFFAKLTPFGGSLLALGWFFICFVGIGLTKKINH